MKKLISALAVVFALVASYSCQREADYITDPTQAVTVTYNVSLDQIQKTKTTLAELDGLAVNKLFYSVYQVVNNELKIIDYSGYHQVVALDAQGTASVTLKVIQGETYKVVFWAQKDGKYVALPASGTDLTLTTDNNVKHSPLENISIDYDNAASYAGDADAFTAVDEFSIAVGGENITKSVHLKRPFAQINFGASDAAVAADLGYTAYSAAVSVKQVATSFNALTGVAGSTADKTLLVSVLPETPVDFDINAVTYTRVAKAYVLPAGTFTVSQNDNSAGISSPLSGTSEVSLTLTIKKGDNSFEIGPRVNANTPIRSNYRTNLLGSLITADATFSVVVDNDFEGSTDHISIVSLGNAAGSGAITMEDPETINTSINFGDHPVTLDAPLTINGNVTISSNNEAITITHDDVSGEDNSIVVASGATLTLSGVDLQGATGVTTLVKVEQGGHLIITSGTYAGEYFVNLVSGSSNPAPVAPGVQHRAKGADGDQLIIRGGTFVGFNPTPYVDDVHYTITEDPTGTWTVTAKQVTLTVESGDVSMKLGDNPVQKTISTDPADAIDGGVTFSYSVDGIATATYDAGTISIAAVGVGSTVITVTVGSATATINVTVAEADSISVSPASLSVKVGETSAAVTVTLNNNATVTNVAPNNANCTVNWTSGNTFTVTGAAIGESVVTVTASNSKTATVAVTVSKADAVKLSAPVLSTENAVAGETSIMLDWADVEHASGYAVSYGAESPVNVTASEVTLSNLALATQYTISVVAKGDGDAYTDSDASNSIIVSTDKGVVSIVLANDLFELVEGTAAVSQAQIEAVVKYGETTVTGATITYAVKDDSNKGNVSVSSTGLITAGEGEAAATILVNYAGSDIYKAAPQQEVGVIVNAKEVESISLNTNLVQKTFELNEEFTHANIVVTANYNNNTTADVTSQATFSTPNMATAGDQTITVSYGGKSATYTIHVNDAVPVTLTSVAITTQASVTTFTEGDVFVATDLVLTGTYSDNSTQVLDPTFEIGGEVVTPGTTTLSGTGDKTVTVYSASDPTKTDSYTITVNAAQLPAIQDVTVAQFNAAEPSETQRYRLTGIISNVTSTKYGNFDITDDTGTVYVYGLYPEEVEYGTSNPGDSYFNTLSVAAGDQITIVGYRYTHSSNNVDKIEVMYAFHEAHVNALAAPANLVVGKTNDNKITASWDDVTGAASYTVKIGDEEFANATSPFTSASAYADGTYSVSVKAVGSTAPDSPYCTAQSVTIGDVQSGLSLPFNETFTGSNGSAGFSGSSGNGNTPQYDNENWDVTNAYGASDAIKLGKSGEGGKAITPAINFSGDATLTFKAGAWSGDQTTLKVSVSSGHIENTSGETITSVTINDAAWSVLHLYLKGVSAGFSVTFESNQASKARFFLDDVTIVEGIVEPAARALESISVLGQTSSFKQGDSFEFGGTVTATYTDATTADVTDKATFTGYDMSTISESQTVTVTYTENNVTKTTTYTIAVTDPNAGTNYSTLYTTDSGVTLSGGSSAQVVIGGTSYSAVKLEGRSGKTIQSLSITIPTGTTKVHLFIGAWNNGNASVTVSGGSIDNASLTADSGISNNTPFTLSSSSTDSFYKVITVANNATSITITPSGERILIWGVNPE